MDSVSGIWGYADTGRAIREYEKVDWFHEKSCRGLYPELQAAVWRLGGAGCRGGQLSGSNAQWSYLYGIFCLFHRAFCKNMWDFGKGAGSGRISRSLSENSGKISENIFHGRGRYDRADPDRAYSGTSFWTGAGEIPGKNGKASDRASGRKRRASGNRICGHTLFLPCTQQKRICGWSLWFAVKGGFPFLAVSGKAGSHDCLGALGRVKARRKYVEPGYEFL